MTKIAVISDVHAHLDALEAVLAAADQEGAEEVWFLGDAVGYGPFPNETVERLRAASALSIAGNHDLLVAGRLKFGEWRDHSQTAIDSGAWTKETLAEGNLAWLEQLAKAADKAEFELHHGSRISPLTYVITAEDASLLVNDPYGNDKATGTHFLLGHVHWPRAWSFDEADVDEYGFVPPVQHELPDEARFELQGRRWAFNPGSVGFSRVPGDKRARWLLLDLNAQTATFKQAEVDHSRTQQAIRDSGLPTKIADTL